MRSVQLNPMEQFSKKSVFFSVPRLFLKNFLQFLRELHCWIADILKYTNPGEQNCGDRVLEERKETVRLQVLYFPYKFVIPCGSNKSINFIS